LTPINTFSPWSASWLVSAKPCNTIRQGRMGGEKIHQNKNGHHRQKNGGFYLITHHIGLL
jgi:hypothetical protein